MPAYSKEREQQFIERIKEIQALKQNATGMAIREMLERDQREPLTLHLQYINKLRRKISAERSVRYDRAKVDSRLAEIQDRTESVIGQMWKILLNTMAADGNRVAAANTIIGAEHKFLEAQMNAGIFERQLGTVKVDHEHTLSDSAASLILTALGNYGLIKSANIIEQPALELPRPADGDPAPQQPADAA